MVTRTLIGTHESRQPLGVADVRGWSHVIVPLVVAEHFRRPGLSQHQNCTLVAAELGMTTSAVERALLRARKVVSAP